MDEDAEYLITNSNPKGVDESNIIDSFAMMNDLHAISEVASFIQGEFGSRIYFGRKLAASDAINKTKLIRYMDEDDKFLFVYYLLT